MHSVIIQFFFDMYMQMDEKMPTMRKPNPYYNKSFKITLLDSLLDDKYCVYKLLYKTPKQFSHTYLSFNIKDKCQYIIKFYKLNQIQYLQQMQRFRFMVLKRAEIYFNLKSSYVVKCQSVYENQCYMAIVYQHFQESSLKEEIFHGRIAPGNYRTILRHMFMAVLATHKAGLFTKKLDLSKIYFKNGYYKLTDFDIFWSQHDQNDIQICPQLHHPKDQHKSQQLTPRCDIWALALFYLKLVLGQQYRKQMLNNHKSGSVFTRQLQQKLQQKMIMCVDEQDKQFLKTGLMIDAQDRTGWKVLFKILRLDKQIRKTQKLNNNNNNEYDLQSYIEKEQNQNKKNTVLKRTFLINTSQNMVYSQEQLVGCKAYLDEQKQFGDNIKSQLMQSSIFTPFYLSLYINKFTYTLLLQQDIKIFLQGLQKKQIKLYKILQKQYFEAQKSQYILINLIIPIQNYRLLDMQNKKNLQFMYLVCSRLFTNLSYITSNLRQYQYSQQQSKIRKQYQKIIEPIYSQSKKRFNKYSQLLTTKQNSWLCIIRDRCKTISNKQQKVRKDYFLVGIQGIDYGKQEQIQYTINMYMSRIIQELEENFDHSFIQGKNHKKNVIINICKNYKDIMFLVDTNQIRGKQFQECVQEILRNNKQNRKNSKNKLLNLSPSYKKMQQQQQQSQNQFKGYGQYVQALQKNILYDFYRDFSINSSLIFLLHTFYLIISTIFRQICQFCSYFVNHI